jgi:hypothetical protein
VPLEGKEEKELIKTRKSENHTANIKDSGARTL